MVKLVGKDVSVANATEMREALADFRGLATSEVTDVMVEEYMFDSIRQVVQMYRGRQRDVADPVSVADPLT